MAPVLRDLLESASRAGGGVEQLRTLTRLAPVFGELAGHPALIEAVAPAWQALREQGVAATLAGFARG